MWGDWYFNPKQRKIVGKKAAGESILCKLEFKVLIVDKTNALWALLAAGKLKPLFVQFALEPIWQLYLTAEAETQGQSYGGKSLSDMARSLKLEVRSQERICSPSQTLGLETFKLKGKELFVFIMVPFDDAAAGERS